MNLVSTELVNRDSQELGLYIDDEIQLTKRLKVIGGVRQDHNTLLPGDKWYTGLRSALVYQTTDDWVTKAMFNRAVRMPSALAAMNTVFGSNNPNPPPWAALAPTPQEPETLSTVELQNTFTVGKMRLGINVYHEDLDNFISWYEPWTNVGNFRGTGVEITARAPISECTVLWANTSYCNSELMPFAPYEPKPGPVDPTHIIINPDGHIIGSPQWTANLGFDRKLTEHLTLSPTVRYFTEQAAFDYTDLEFITIRNIFYFDATLTWKEFLTKNMDLSLSIYNIFDNRDQIAAQWTSDTYKPRGTSGVASLSWRF
jgi:outer membrane receptor protein involved in Fe transport